MGPSWLGTAIVIFVLLFLHLIWYLRNKQLSRVPDIMLTYMLNWPKRSNGPIWLSLLLIISVVLGIVIPSLAGHGMGWFQTKSGLIITLTYTILGPILLLSYIELARAAQAFFEPSNLRDLGLSASVSVTSWTQPRGPKLILLISLVLLVLGGFVTWFGIFVVTKPIDAESGSNICRVIPWVTKEGDSCHLGYVGLVYYVVLRGLNAYLAIGLMLLTLVIFVSLHCGIKYNSCVPFVRHDTNNRTTVSRLIVWLTMCALSGPALLFSHGAGLYFYAAESRTSNNVVQSLIDWGWLGWLSASLVSTYFLLSSAFWLYARNQDAVSELVAKAHSEVETGYLARGKSLVTFSQKIEAVLNTESYERALRRKTITGYSVLLGALSIVLQIIGVVVSLFAVF